MNNHYSSSVLAAQHRDHLLTQARRERLVRDARSPEPQLVDRDARVRRTGVMARLASIVSHARSLRVRADQPALARNP